MLEQNSPISSQIVEAHKFADSNPSSVKIHAIHLEHPLQINIVELSYGKGFNAYLLCCNTYKTLICVFYFPMKVSSIVRYLGFMWHT